MLQRYIKFHTECMSLLQVYDKICQLNITITCNKCIILLPIYYKVYQTKITSLLRRSNFHDYVNGYKYMTKFTSSTILQLWNYVKVVILSELPKIYDKAYKTEIYVISV